MIYFWAQNDPEIGPLMPIFNTNLKVGGGVRRNGRTVCSLTHWGVGGGGVRRNGRTVCSLTGDYRTTNDAWKSSVHKRHASPWRCIVASWRQLLWRHEGDVPEVLPWWSPRDWQNYGSSEIPNLRHCSFGTPRAFPHQLIGCGRVNLSPMWEDRHLGCLSSGWGWVGMQAWFVGEWVTIRGWVTGWIKSMALYLNPWRHGVKKRMSSWVLVEGPPAQPNSDNDICTDAPPINGVPHRGPQ